MTGAGEEMICGIGDDLFVRSWLPAGASKAILAICPGFNSHSGYYSWVGERCAAAGLATYAVDLRGRGRSSGERFYVESFDDYVADLAALIAHARGGMPSLPLFVLGHSAGGVIACLYALDHGAEMAGLVCEDFAFEVPAPALALEVLKGLRHVAPHAHSIRLKNEDFSRDPAVLDTMKNDPLIAGEAQPLATMAAIVRADERLKHAFEAITVPLLILHGGADRAAKASGSEQFHHRAGSADKTLRLFPDRYHDPLNDIGKEEVMGDILAWIGARISTSTAE